MWMYCLELIYSMVNVFALLQFDLCYGQCMCSVRGSLLDDEQFGLPGFDSEPWSMCVHYLGLFLCQR